METRNIFENISCIDHRYSLSEAEVFNGLSKYISEEASIRSCAKCEAALVKSHLKLRGKLTDEIAQSLDKVASKIDPAEVYAEEEKTKHNIRALVNVMKTKVSAEIGPLVHLGATSVDILDTALSCRMRDVTKNVVLPELKKLEKHLCAIADRDSEVPQVGRTHGQHAVPITFGWSIAEFVSRLGKSILRIEELSNQLVGKLAGPVGSYNGPSMIVKDPEELERVYVEFLGLSASEYSNQLVEPEYLLRLLLEMNVAFGIIANLADDLRNLQRSEIGEVFEYFASTQVGSSTMPQKRNPWNSEHVKSLWKAMCPRVITFYMDQISEHQRDLTNSASQRFMADYVAGFTMAVARMNSVVSGLQADKETMARNLENAGGKVKGGVLAEPAYILLGEAGINDGHEVIRKITLEAEKSGKTFFEVLKTHKEAFEKITAQLEKLGVENPENFFEHPANYCGLAAKKSRRLAKKYEKLMD
ncbi:MULTISPECIES: lyase family protein [Treponema]|uniref:Adenylosuccinate lyase n=1 Tax=Treponema succinifaciens (strain ATCC 33096 / DSM 2489 / 6091) TaxID=869209 RepID=F2NUF8_TRES6|nr:MULTISPECIES: lyase family protein [Treponema]MDD6970404.1 lyase family protein [Spirochaetales bacterium]AEB13251.1 Adenylosuccinate lyase [Treponema succinifaciens DSM 2489]MCI6912465.1 lyase family protein [Treponema succinifaciens]MDY2616965.1 lyase family protein [Treponema succinifaciens]MDY6191375.1 lyase family protein [Treponema sp.]